MMKIKYIGIVSIVFLLSSCSKSLYYKSVTTDYQCSAKDGYWHKDKCWKEFEDDGISVSDIDSIVAADMAIIEKSIINVGDNVYHLLSFLPIEQGGHMLLIAVYESINGPRTLILPVKNKNLRKNLIESNVLVFNGDALSDDMDSVVSYRGNATINVIDFEALDLEITGEMFSVDGENRDTLKFNFKPNISILGAGNSKLEVRQGEAYLSGDLGTVTYDQIKYLIKYYPNVKTIVMTHISGSVNDAVNMHTGRLLHENGFTTKVLRDSDIASGGVDLFCAGTTRIVEEGAKIGVHSWCCVGDLKANEIPKEHPSHMYQLEYFKMVLGEESGPDFYFYTLESADFDDVHYMSDEEIVKWNVATEFLHIARQY